MEGMKHILITFILAISPVSELRVAIPYGLKHQIPFHLVFLISIIGNILPVIPLYFFLEKLIKFLGKYRYGKKFNNWLIERTKKKSKIIETYETIGLLIFVGIPLPTTGAWTGTIASVIFQLKFKNFIIGVIGGILMAGIIVSFITVGLF
jgi:uncharacterized membrane protein